MAAETKINITAVDKTQRAFSSVQTSLKKMTGALTSAKAAVGGLVASFAVKEFTGFLDTATRIENKLKLVTKSSAELAKAQAEVYRVAQTTGAGLEVTADLYSKIVSSTEALNLSSKDQIRITETVSKAISISGASAEGAAGAIIQLGQALSSGALRGEEFNSVNEAAPRIMQALADSLGVARGDLKKLASDGVLTADIVTEALLIQSQTIDEEYGKTTTTVAESFTTLKNSAVVFFGVLDKNTGISTLFSDALSRMARGLTNVTEAIKPATVSSLTKEINDLSFAQRDELLALDKLVTENGNLNVMQQNQARIMRLNIAERGEQIKKLKAERDSLDKLAATQKEETKEANKANGSSKLSAELLERRNKLREKVNTLTGGTLKLSEKEIKLQKEIYEIGQKNSLITGEVSEANKAFFESMKGYATTAEEVVATELQKKIFLQAHADLMAQQEETANRLNNIGLQRKRFLEEHAKLMEAAKENKRKQLEFEESIYAVGQKNSLVTGQVSEANKAFFKQNEKYLSVSNEILSTELQRKIFLQAHADLMEAANKKKEEQLELEEKIYAIGKNNSLMTGQANAANVAYFKQLEKFQAGQNEAEKSKTKELAKQYSLYQRAPVKDLDLLTKLQIKAMGTVTDIAGSAAFGAVTGAAGASGGRAMNIAQATAQGGPMAGIAALVLSNKKVQEALGKVFDAIFALIDPLIDLLVPALDALTPAIEELKPVFESLKPYFVALGAALKVQAVYTGQLFRGVSELVKVVESNTAFVRDFGVELEKFGPKVEQVGKDLEKFGQGFLDGIKTIGETLLNGVKAFVEGFGQALLDLPASIGTTVYNAIAGLPQAIYDAIKGLFSIGGSSSDGLLGGSVIPGILKDGGYIPKAQGGMLVGQSHSSGGKIIEAEGGEFIFSREAVKRIGAARLNNMNNGMADYTPAVEVNIYDGTGQRISEYDSALRVEIKERAARNNKFPAVA